VCRLRLTRQSARWAHSPPSSRRDCRAYRAPHRIPTESTHHVPLPHPLRREKSNRHVRSLLHTPRRPSSRLGIVPIFALSQIGGFAPQQRNAWAQPRSSLLRADTQSSRIRMSCQSGFVHEVTFALYAFKYASMSVALERTPPLPKIDGHLQSPRPAMRSAQYTLSVLKVSTTSSPAWVMYCRPRRVHQGQCDYSSGRDSRRLECSPADGVASSRSHASKMPFPLYLGVDAFRTSGRRSRRVSDRDRRREAAEHAFAVRARWAAVARRSRGAAGAWTRKGSITEPTQMSTP